MNKFQRRFASILCIFRSIFFFKPFVGLVAQNRKTSDRFRQFLFSRYIKRDFVHFFNFLSKNFLFTFKNLLVHLFYLKNVTFFSSSYVLSTLLTYKFPKLAHILHTFWTTCRYPLNFKIQYQNFFIWGFNFFGKF